MSFPFNLQILTCNIPFLRVSWWLGPARDCYIPTSDRSPTTLAFRSAHSFVWDTFVWAAHVALHHPSLYSKYHKLHHEFQAPMILVAEHFTPLDAVLEATVGAYLGNYVGRTSFFALWCFGMWRLWTVIHNHCGFELPWDVMNQVFGYVNVGFEGQKGWAF